MGSLLLQALPTRQLCLVVLRTPVLLLSPPPLGQPTEDSEKRLYVCLRPDLLGSPWLGLAHRTGSRQGPDVGGSRQRRAGTKPYPRGWGQSKAPPEEDKRTTQVPCSPPPQSGHLIAVVSDMPLCIASVPWEQRAGMAGIPVMRSPERIRRGFFLWKRAHVVNGRDAQKKAERKKSKKRCPRGS